jgi:hypothetical protein
LLLERDAYQGNRVTGVSFSIQRHFSFDLKRMSESRPDCFRFPHESVKIPKTIKDVGQQPSYLPRQHAGKKKTIGKAGTSGSALVTKGSLAPMFGLVADKPRDAHGNT